MAGPLLPPFLPTTAEGLIPVARELAADLRALQPRTPVSWPLAITFNDLLDSARRVRADDAVLTTIARLTPEDETANGTVVALLGQIAAALGEAT